MNPEPIIGGFAVLILILFLTLCLTTGPDDRL